MDLGEPASADGTGPPEVRYIGETVCYSGVEGGYRCASVTEFEETHIRITRYPTWEWNARGLRTIEGDSGGPIWNVRTNAPVGMVSAGAGGFTPLLPATREEDGVVIGWTAGAQGSLSRGALQFVGR